MQSAHQHTHLRNLSLKMLATIRPALFFLWWALFSLGDKIALLGVTLEEYMDPWQDWPILGWYVAEFGVLLQNVARWGLRFRPWKH